MMSSLLRKLAVVSCACLVGVSAYAEAKWSVSKISDIKDHQALINTSKTQSHFVQIFSSISATKAEGMKNTLEMQGYPAFIKVHASHQKPHYQVQVGPFGSKSLAHNAKTSIVKLYPQFPFLNDAILRISF